MRLGRLLSNGHNLQPTPIDRSDRLDFRSAPTPEIGAYVAEAPEIGAYVAKAPEIGAYVAKATDTCAVVG